MCNLNDIGVTCDEQQFSSSYFIEKGSDDECADEADDGEWQHVEADLVLMEVEGVREDVRVLIVDEIEKECLSEDETEADNEFFGVFEDSLFQEYYYLLKVVAEGFYLNVWLFIYLFDGFEADLVLVHCLND